MSQIFNSRLWKTAFSKQDDGYDECRKKLESSLISFRDRVKTLISFIPNDMKWYTVHDITHLDALWEMADIISGEDYTLNPAEAFVFGGAVLLHDAGMTVAAYKDGIDELRTKDEWKDAFISRLKSLAVKQSTIEEDINKNQEQANLATIDILRHLHANKAQELATQFWLNPNKEQVYLCEDSDLRSHYGSAIGQIANSHHWEIRRIAKELGIPLGAFSTFPTEWKIDRVKVALLLRCADSAHIDSRRAPHLLLTLTKPLGVAFHHWTFQNKLAKPTTDSSRLLYSSTSTFKVEEAEAWQLCLDAIQLIDKELSNSADILHEKGNKPFAITGVVGSKSAEGLAEYIKVEGWKPVSTEIQVSNVPHLAKVLGGRDLYSNLYAPLRELIQNAADAVEARTFVDKDFSMEDGKIKLRVTEISPEEVLFELEDNGIGMSEKVLVNSLLDFGKSFWGSDEAKSEFPGLHSQFINPRGKYGIGFFSIFMWADNVSVYSRRFDTGKMEANILEFKSGLGTRPILRSADGSFSTQCNTRVSFKVPKDKVPSLIVSDYILTSGNIKYSYQQSPVNINSFEPLLCLLTAPLPIEVRFEYNNKTTTCNLQNWREADTDLFLSLLERIYGNKFEPANVKFTQSLSSVICQGKKVGKVLLLPVPDDDLVKSEVLVYERGIFIGTTQLSSAHGLIEGRSINASREKIVPINILNDSAWLAKQIDQLARLCDNQGEVLACQRALLKIEAFDRKAKLFVLNRSMVSLDRLIELLPQIKKVKISLEEKRKTVGKTIVKRYTATKTDDIGILTNLVIDEFRLYFLADFPVGLTEEEIDGIIKKNPNQNNSALNFLITSISNAMGTESVINFQFYNPKSYSIAKAMMLTISTNP